MTVHIPARVRTDNGVYDESFDAAAWFTHATEADIRGLADCGWGGDYEADHVAELTAERGAQWADVTTGEDAPVLRDAADRLTQLFDYDQRNIIGFEVYVEEDAARKWLAANRPEVTL